MSSGAVYGKEALEIRDFMRQEIEKGNRFVSFEYGKEGLTKEDFAVFKTAFDAHEYAYENTTDRDIYIVRSIASVEKGMDRLLGQESETLLLMNMKKEVGQLLDMVEKMQQQKSFENSQEVKLGGQMSR